MQLYHNSRDKRYRIPLGAAATCEEINLSLRVKSDKVPDYVKLRLWDGAEKKLDMTRFLGPGGMPSSHSTLVTSLATCVGIHDGFDSVTFVMCCAFALVVMYDASGIRRAAGQQAKMINMIVDAWNESDPLEKQMRLKEILGHTPVEVCAGATLGVVFALVSNAIFGL